MSRNRLRTLLLSASVAVAAVAFAGNASAFQDWGCTGSTEATCPDSDDGCSEENEHYVCYWSVVIEHCNCSLKWPGGGL
jgi:hypothetical protein